MDKLPIIKNLVKIAEILERSDKVLLANEINYTITKLAQKEKIAQMQLKI